LASVGRYKVNKKLDLITRLETLVNTRYKLAVEEDLVNPETGEVVIEKGLHAITKELCDELRLNRASIAKL
jgi:DNA-directed RNA polymerase subunit beta